MGGYFEGLMNSQMTMEFFLPDGVNGGAATLAIVAMLSMLFQQPYAAENDQSVVRSETLLRSATCWDGERYKSYPPGQPELSTAKPSAMTSIGDEMTTETRATSKQLKTVNGRLKTGEGWIGYRNGGASGLSEFLYFAYYPLVLPKNSSTRRPTMSKMPTVNSWLRVRVRSLRRRPAVRSGTHHLRTHPRPIPCGQEEASSIEAWAPQQVFLQDESRADRAGGHTPVHRETPSR